ncbi:hypothetical protein [Loigolactobacillus coryniformis]|nr:hypothetical protein [Loigolactobacillus coryniformis]
MPKIFNVTDDATWTCRTSALVPIDIGKQVPFSKQVQHLIFN